MSEPASTAGRDTSLLSGELRLAGRLDSRFFALLQALQASGSLQKAARAAGYSYKGAWLVLEQAGTLARTPLVLSQTGGRRGGGSQLTVAALELLHCWQHIQQRHQVFLAEQDAWLMARPQITELLRNLAMKSTARNQFSGAVSDVSQGPATTQVSVDIGHGHTVTASLTTAAAQRLGVAVGQPALALVKSSEVVLVCDFAGYKLSACNQLAGTVSRLQKGAVSSLVGVTLPGGSVVTSSVTNDAVDALGLAVGQPVTASFKAYAVMLAVAA